MAIREITTVGDPVLTTRAREITRDELASPEVQALIDDLIETKRAARGAGLAANQVGVAQRIAVVEVEPGNPRYPYKPPFPLTVLVNPVLEPVGDDVAPINEGCLSVPDLRGDVPRHLAVRARYLDRDGAAREQVVRGLTAGTFQHEVDHLDGVLFLERVTDRKTFSTWEQFDRHRRAEFERRAAEITRWAGS
ncbi:MAG TPA: peptide deformylase [Solirubrobacterales bacterium]|nr:peptide deformylase [Solirubrobacterales bacterium]